MAASRSIGLALLVAVALPNGGGAAGSDAWRVGWPALHGPTGNLLPAPSDAPWGDDPSDARLARVSDDADFGAAKTGSQTFRSAKEAEGEVACRLDAEDVVFALDAATGKTLWRTAEPGGATRAWTPLGRNAPGTRTLVLQLAGVLPFKSPAAGLTLCLDHDGTTFVRGAAGAVSCNQAWHEVDPSGPRFDGRQLSGRATVILNADAWVFPNQELRTGVAGVLALDALPGPEGFTGRGDAVRGESFAKTGAIAGRIEGAR